MVWGGEQARHCTLHHAFVGRIEAIFVADGSDGRIIQIALCCSEQALDVVTLCLERYQTLDLQQVF